MRGSTRFDRGGGLFGQEVNHDNKRPDQPISVTSRRRTGGASVTRHDPQLVKWNNKAGTVRRAKTLRA